MWYVRDVLYTVLYVRVSCFVVRGCGVSRRYIALVALWQRVRLRARMVKVRLSLWAIVLSLENLNVIIRAIN